tara:strand:- start:1249 stop:2328 length:1080 start_codon:yes stop_codon:yes gene_type:complete
MSKIKGIEQKRGWYYYRPSQAGLDYRPKAIALRTKDFDDALKKVIGLFGVDFQNQGKGIGQWFEAYINERKRGNHYAPSVLYNVRLMVGKFISFIGQNKDPKTVNKADAMDFYNDLNDGSRTASSAHAYIRYCRAFFTWLTDRDVIAVNPFSRLKLPTPAETRRAHFLEADQRDHLLDVCENSRIKYRAEMMFVLYTGFFCGMRIKEILNAKWKWFSIRAGKGTVHVMNEKQIPGVDGKAFATKNRREKKIPMNKRYLSYFKTLPKGAPEEYVLFPDKGGELHRTRGHRWDCRGSWKSVVTDAGFPHFTPHGMRHTFGSLHAMAGTPEIKIIRWMGITRDVFDKHYAGLSEFDEDADRI